MLGHERLIYLVSTFSIMATPITFLGDIHGMWGAIPQNHPNRIICVGDLGIGFQKYFDDKPTFPDNFSFISGNHDSPELCKSIPNFLGRFGYKDGIFFVSGAWSIDGYKRIEGHDKWHDEELNWQEWNECVSLYEQVKPKIVVSHDAPLSIVSYLRSQHSGDRSGTQRGLESMLNQHAPKLWIYGHHHQSSRIETSETTFICLGINELLTIDIETV